MRSSLFCSFGGLPLTGLAPGRPTSNHSALGPEAEAEAEAGGVQDGALGQLAATLPGQQASVSAEYPPSVSVPATFISGDELRCEAPSWAAGAATVALRVAVSPHAGSSALASAQHVTAAVTFSF